MIQNISIKSLLFVISHIHSRHTTYYCSHKVLRISSGIEDMGSIKWDLLLTLAATWLLVWLCVSRGIKSSGKAVYVTVPLPYIMITILIIRGLTLPGSLDGIKFYLIPDWSKLTSFKVGIPSRLLVVGQYIRRSYQCMSMRRANKNQFMRRRNQISFVLQPIEAWNVYNMILCSLMIISICVWFACLVLLLIKEALKRQIIRNTWQIQAEKRGVLKYY